MDKISYSHKLKTSINKKIVLVRCTKKRIVRHIFDSRKSSNSILNIFFFIYFNNTINLTWYIVQNHSKKVGAASDAIGF